MTTKAQKLSQAIKEVSWDWGSMQPSDPHTIAVATLREVVSLLQYDNVIIDVKDILELANELDVL